MTKKLLTSILLNTILILLPLILKPELMLHYKILLIVAGSGMLWLTQPVFTVKETQDAVSSDKFSVLIILIMSFVSGIVPITIWAYGNINQSLFNWVTVTGIFLIIVGIVLRARSVTELGIYFTPTVQIQQHHKLITSGPYKLIRHPSYSGAFLAITGSALVLNTIAGYFVAVAAMTFCYSIRIKIEEKELINHFGEHYLKYIQRTKKLIPFIF